MEEIVARLSTIDMGWVYLAVLLIAYIENIFPPFPSDVIVVFAGSLVAMGEGSGVLTVAAATLGSTFGFVTMYKIGDAFGDRILEKGKIRFISMDLIHRVEQWFRRYGYWVIIANRFLAGTRAVVSFGAGMSEMRLVPTTALSAVSALAWNTILVVAGIALGSRWRDISSILATYSTVVSIVIVAALAVWLLRMFVLSRRARSRNGTGERRDG